MNLVYYFFETIQNFMNLGGWVLYGIFFCSFCFVAFDYRKVLALSF